MSASKEDATKAQSLREKHRQRRGRKAAFRASPNHVQQRQQQGQNDSETADDINTPTGIHKLPRELTDMIWEQSATWPTKEALASGAIPKDDSLQKTFAIVRRIADMDDASEEDHDGSTTDIHNVKIMARGEISGVYSLAPPPLASLCRETRQFCLEQYGLVDKNNEPTKKLLLSNTKRRWEREYAIPVLLHVCPSTHPETCMSTGNLVAIATIMAAAQAIGTALFRPRHIRDAILPSAESLGLPPGPPAEDTEIDLPLDELLHHGKYNQLILDLCDLGNRSFWTKYLDPQNPLGTYSHAIMDMILSARDGQILVAHPAHVSYRPKGTIYMDGRQTKKTIRDWQARKARYVPLDDVAVWRDLQITFGDNDTHMLCERHSHEHLLDDGGNDYLLEERELVKKILDGPEERQRLREQTLKPFRDLWERINAEQRDNGLPPLKKLPEMDVVVYVQCSFLPLDPRNGDQRVLRSARR